MRDVFFFRRANGLGVPVTREEIEDVLFEMMIVLDMRKRFAMLHFDRAKKSN